MARASRTRPFALPAALAKGLLAALAAPLDVSAQDAGPIALPAATVAVDDPATTLVDRLLLLVPVPGGIAGQRPYSAREVARLARAVRAQLDARSAQGAPDAGDAQAREIADALLAAYAPGASGAGRGLVARPLDFVWGHATGSGTGPVRYRDDTGVGRIDATTLPGLEPSAGRPLVQGAVGSVETAHAVGVGGWLALVAQPRASLVAPYAGGEFAAPRWNVEPQRLFARAVVRNVALQAGIDDWAWGQNGAAGAFLSANARPLRALAVQSDTAFALPGALRRLGRWRASFLVADLGRAQNFPHAKLAAYKVSLAARPTVEVGAGVMSQFGGRGAPGMSIYQRAADLFPFIGWLDEGSDLLRSNKRADLDVRLRVPRWRGLAVAYELTIDDFDLRRPRSMLWEDSGNLLAVSVPRLAGGGALALDLRAQRTGLREYRHYQFFSGVTYRGQVLGAPLGPNAGALGGTLTWRPRALDAASLDAAYEFRDPSLFVNVNPDINGALIFRRAVQLTEDRRLRLVAGWERAAAGRGRTVTARAGVERIEGFGFAEGPVLVRPVAEVGVRARF